MRVSTGMADRELRDFMLDAVRFLFLRVEFWDTISTIASLCRFLGLESSLAVRWPSERFSVIVLFS